MYLQGGSDATQYLQYLPAAANLSAGTNFTQLAPVVDQQQYIVRDWPLAGAERSGSSSSSSGSGTEGGSGNDTSSSSGRYVYAVVHSAERRNGELVVAPLGPDTLAGAAGWERPSTSDTNDTAGEAAAAAPPPPASAPAPAPAARNETGGNATLAPTPAPSSAAAPASAPAAVEPSGNATAGGSSAGSSNATATGESSSNATSTSHVTVLQAHSRDVEIVDITVSSGHLAVLERRNGTLVATAYPLPKDGGWGGAGRTGLMLMCLGSVAWSLRNKEDPAACHAAHKSLVRPAATHLLAIPWLPSCCREPSCGAAQGPAVQLRCPLVPAGTGRPGPLFQPAASSPVQQPDAAAVRV